MRITKKREYLILRSGNRPSLDWLSLKEEQVGRHCSHRATQCHGWADVQELIDGINRSGGHSLDMEKLEGSAGCISEETTGLGC